MLQFKIDENLHADAAELLRQQGHDAITVYDQNLQGEADTNIANVCRQEQRVIVTLDLDFSDIRQYPPKDYPGIIVLRLNDQSRVAVLNVLRRILPQYAPATFLRIEGQNPLVCTLHRLERLRCNACGAYFTAQLSPEAQADGEAGQTYGYSPGEKAMAVWRSQEALA